jgi:PAS domain
MGSESALEAVRQAEQKYRSIFEHCVIGIFQTTPEGQYLSANPALARRSGYNSPEQLIGALTDISRLLYVKPGRRPTRSRESTGASVSLEQPGSLANSLEATLHYGGQAGRLAPRTNLGLHPLVQSRCTSVARPVDPRVTRMGSCRIYEA